MRMEENKNAVRSRGTDSARVIRVIETRAIRGIGNEDDLCREVIQYWDFEGNLLAEQDDCQSECLGFSHEELVRLNTMVGIALQSGKIEFDEISESIHKKIADELITEQDAEQEVV